MANALDETVDAARKYAKKTLEDMAETSLMRMIDHDAEDLLEAFIRMAWADGAVWGSNRIMEKWREVFKK